MSAGPTTLSPLEFLSSSPLGAEEGVGESFRGLSDRELKEELYRYRSNSLSQPLVRAPGGLSIAISAREDAARIDAQLKNSVLYFDEVLVPDPIFRVGEWSRGRPRNIWEDVTAPRKELVEAVEAVRYIRALRPLMLSGKVRLVPSSYVLEPPEPVPVYFPRDLFADEVPTNLRDWFDSRARVRKVAITDDRKRLVLAKPVDEETHSIQVDFGQVGTVATYDFMHVERIAEDGVVWGRIAPPSGGADGLRDWVTQSTNKSAANYLRDVVRDASVAWRYGSSFATSCNATSELMQEICWPGVARDNAAAAALSLNLPTVETSSSAMLADLIESESAAFSALKMELRKSIDLLSDIEDPAERAAELVRLQRKLAKEHVWEVEQRLKEIRRGRFSRMRVSSSGLAGVVLGALAAGGNAVGVVGGAGWCGDYRGARDSRELIASADAWVLSLETGR